MKVTIRLLELIPYSNSKVKVTAVQFSITDKPTTS